MRQGRSLWASSLAAPVLTSSAMTPTAANATHSCSKNGDIQTFKN